jgi:hypothetical protein
MWLVEDTVLLKIIAAGRGYMVEETMAGRGYLDTEINFKSWLVEDTEIPPLGFSITQYQPRTRKDPLSIVRTCKHTWTVDTMKYCCLNSMTVSAGNVTPS